MRRKTTDDYSREWYDLRTPLPCILEYQENEAIEYFYLGAWYEGKIRSVKARSLRVEWRDRQGMVYQTRVRFDKLQNIRKGE